MFLSVNLFITQYRAYCSFFYFIEQHFENFISKMVCDKCEKKLGITATPDPWKQGCRNAIDTGNVRKQDNKHLQSIGRVKTLSGSKVSSNSTQRMGPSTVMYSSIRCGICKQNVYEPGRHYCQNCAYKKGICSMCGVRILNTKSYKQSAT